MFSRKLLFTITALLFIFSFPSYAQGPEAEALLQTMMAGKVVFERECSACHPVERALLSDYSREEWQEIIGKMLSEKKDLTEGEEAAVTLFLDGGSSFNRSCITCHTRDRCFSRNMNLQNWTMIVRKMKLRIEGGISKEEAWMVAAYLAASCPER